MATVRIIARKSKRDDEGTLPLCLPISHKGKERTVSQSERIHEKHWNPRREEVRKSHPHFSKLNSLLSRQRTTAEKIVVHLKTQGHEPHAAEAKDRYTALGAPEDEAEDLDSSLTPLPSWSRSRSTKFVAPWQTTTRPSTSSSSSSRNACAAGRSPLMRCL